MQNSENLRNGLVYDPALDGLRGFSVAAVIMCHAYNSVAPGGWVGVDVFFVLSGYLITSLLRDELAQRGAVNLWRFYYRRLLRLMPPLWCLLLALLPIVLLWHPDQLKGWLTSAAYVMNWNRAFGWAPDYVLGHTWSLSEEEQFYLLWPAAFLCLANRRPLRWLCGLLLIAIVWRCYSVWRGAAPNWTYNNFFTHSDPIILGCILALVEIPADVARMFAKLWFVWIVVFLSLGATLAFGLPFTHSIGITLTSLTGAALLISSRDGPLRRILTWQPAVFTGKISYALYLWHYPLLLFAEKRGLNPLLPIAAAYLIAVASYFTVEAYFRALKRSPALSPVVA
jgi:peptidoglycan/LPS O-acetylase OafA/YrhL